MIMIVLDLVLVMAVIAGIWRLFVWFFWCDVCESASISGNVARGDVFLCRSHALEAREPKGCPTAKK